MESGVFRFSAGSISHACSSLEKPSLAAWPTVVLSHCQALTAGKLSSSSRQARLVMSSAKTPEATVSSKSDDSRGSIEKEALRTTFPSAFEALLLEICDETSVAEVQLKVGDFEMHLKRNIGTIDAPVPVAPPVPSEPMVQSAPAAPSTSTAKPSPEKTTLFASASSVVSSKLASLEASGANGFKLVASPTVGSFQRGRTVKGKKHPPNCKQGDVIKEGQVIGYIDQFGTQLPVKSDVAGEVLKLLFEDGEAVGYGDPLIAVLPSFQGIR